MKKLTLTALALMASVSSNAMMENAFDGMYTGVRTAYQWHNSDFKKALGDKNSKSLDANTFAGDVIVGWMSGTDMTYGLEIFAGYGSGKDKGVTAGSSGQNVSGQVDRKWRYGLDLLAGHKFMENLTGYVRLGMHATVTDFKAAYATSGTNAWKKNNCHMPAVAAGLGAKYALNEDFSLDVGYTYEYDLKEKDYKVGGVKTAEFESGNAHQVHVGVAFTF